MGAHLCRRLAHEGVEVHAVSRSIVPIDGLTTWQADLSDATAARDVIGRTRPDTIFHLASHVSGSRSLDAVLPTLHGNLVAAVNVLVAAAENGCERVVLAGSMEEPELSVAGATPASPYAAAKFGATAYGQMFHALHGLPVVIVRLFMVYGPGQGDHTKLVPYVITSLLRKERPQLSSGIRSVDWVYVDDAVEGFIAAARSPESPGAEIDIGSGALVTIRSLVESIVEAVGTDIEPAFGALPDRPIERVRIADVKRTRALIGWQPRTSLQAGLQATVAWYRLHLTPGTPDADVVPNGPEGLNRKGR